LVAFFRTRPGVSPQGAGALFVMRANGAGLHRITPWGFAFLGQSWSPDGRWIAFERPYGELYLVHPDGSELHRISLRIPAGAGAENPAWSPDGTRIVFSLQRGGSGNIFTVRPDGTGLEQVTDVASGNEQWPDWG
jgi:Tol biopolymer transport system component